MRYSKRLAVVAIAIGAVTEIALAAPTPNIPGLLGSIGKSTTGKAHSGLTGIAAVRDGLNTLGGIFIKPQEFVPDPRAVLGPPPDPGTVPLETKNGEVLEINSPGLKSHSSVAETADSETRSEGGKEEDDGDDDSDTEYLTAISPDDVGNLSELDDLEDSKIDRVLGSRDRYLADVERFEEDAKDWPDKQKYLDLLKTENWRRVLLSFDFYGATHRGAKMPAEDIKKLLDKLDAVDALRELKASEVPSGMGMTAAEEKIPLSLLDDGPEYLTMEDYEKVQNLFFRARAIDKELRSGKIKDPKKVKALEDERTDLRDAIAKVRATLMSKNADQGKLEADTLAALEKEYGPYNMNTGQFTHRSLPGCVEAEKEMKSIRNQDKVLNKFFKLGRDKASAEEIAKLRIEKAEEWNHGLRRATELEIRMREVDKKYNYRLSEAMDTEPVDDQIIDKTLEEAKNKPLLLRRLRDAEWARYTSYLDEIQAFTQDPELSGYVAEAMEQYRKATNWRRILRGLDVAKLRARWDDRLEWFTNARHEALNNHLPLPKLSSAPWGYRDDLTWNHIVAEGVDNIPKDIPDDAPSADLQAKKFIDIRPGLLLGVGAVNGDVDSAEHFLTWKDAKTVKELRAAYRAMKAKYGDKVPDDPYDKELDEMYKEVEATIREANARYFRQASQFRSKDLKLRDKQKYEELKAYMKNPKVREQGKVLNELYKDSHERELEEADLIAKSYVGPSFKERLLQSGRDFLESVQTASYLTRPIHSLQYGTWKEMFEKKPVWTVAGSRKSDSESLYSDEEYADRENKLRTLVHYNKELDAKGGYLHDPFLRDQPAVPENEAPWLKDTKYVDQRPKFIEDFGRWRSKYIYGRIRRKLENPEFLAKLKDDHSNSLLEQLSYGDTVVKNALLGLNYGDLETKDALLHTIPYKDSQTILHKLRNSSGMEGFLDDLKYHLW